MPFNYTVNPHHNVWEKNLTYDQWDDREKAYLERYAKFLAKLKQSLSPERYNKIVRSSGSSVYSMNGIRI